ncbi:hypothetical protein K1W54_04275 [Micromonospora sp. CPCC 205371]|nr:hypothetical protein [Micromonospora sp. CPCC 205371]
MTTATTRKANSRSLRVYREFADKVGIVMCERHRTHYFAIYPSAFGCGEYGGECEPCKAN